MKTNFEDLCLAIDWDLLHKQKLELLEDSMRTGKHDGIVCLIDALQDHAELTGIWEYPEENEEIETPGADYISKLLKGDSDRCPPRS